MLKLLSDIGIEKKIPLVICPQREDFRVYVWRTYRTVPKINSVRNDISAKDTALKATNNGYIVALSRAEKTFRLGANQRRYKIILSAGCDSLTYEMFSY